ncbi:hypothetical protein JP74_08945 [Devosia sp. 17-2-E-8]|nr:hypothetical protein JP74_08945 [Devosia sp. 17-2-E-8]QMV03664.1 hypothetical protein GHV40_20200 [Devosia sp. D6-9]
MRPSISSANVVFRDIVFNCLLVFLLITAILIAHVHPKPEEETGAIDQPGQMYVELVWPSTNNVDVDLMIKDPNDEVTFFRNSATRAFNLVRDDRGLLNDTTGVNFEHAFSRAVPDGWYVVNAYVYALNDGQLPVEVNLIVNMKDFKTVNGPSEQALSQKVVLDAVQVEKTLARFLVVEGKVDPTSISNYQENIMPKLEFTVRGGR